MKSISFIVEENSCETRIDKYLSLKMPDRSRSNIQKLINDGMIQVNGKTVKSNYKLRLNDSITVEIPDAEPLDVPAQPISLDIVYEDMDLLIINKPQGMVVHPAPGHYEGTLVNAVLHHCKDQLSGINGVLRPGIVHRIDKNTSGLLMICKNDKSHMSLANQLKVHSITRTYEAIVHGHIHDDEGTIDAPIGRHPIHRKQMAINYKNGKSAITHYKVIERLSQPYTHVRLNLETGRTHQIRVHMASIHHPIVGDDVYGPKKSTLKLEGQTLHARTLGFIHPTTGEYMEFTSELPDYFQRLLAKLNPHRV